MKPNSHKKSFPKKNKMFQRENKIPRNRSVPEDFPKQGRKIKYEVIFYDTFLAAKADIEKILDLCSTCDQLNIVIKAEGNMDDPDLLGLSTNIKVFAGAAWTLIHERRKEDAWYDEPQEI